MRRTQAGRVRLSDSEWKMMNRLWETPDMSIMELTAVLKEETGWSKGTVITMLGRLEEKGAVRYETNGRTRRYRPAIVRREAAREETESFLERVYGGSLSVMVNAMVESRAISPEELSELSAILDRAREDA